MFKLLYPELVKIWQEQFLAPMDFGEDGGVAISTKYTKWQAYKLIRKHEMDEFGLDASETIKSPKELIISYLHPPGIDSDDDWEWVINREDKSILSVWAYWA